MMYNFDVFINDNVIYVSARQEEATVKRIKLEYDDIGSSGRHNMEVWEMIINKEARKPDNKLLVQAVREGTYALMLQFKL